jgi:hypothetical protein
VDGAAGVLAGENMAGDHPPDMFREFAAECVALAERTTDPDARAKLLIIAQKWVAMANGHEASLAPK